MYSAEDEFSRCGQEHFIVTYGLSSQDTSIQNFLKKSLKKYCTPFTINMGLIKVGSAYLPLFIKPSNLEGQGQPFWYYSTEGEQYPCAVQTNDEITVGFDIFQQIGLILSGCLEHKEKVSFEQSDTLTTFPYVDIYEHFLYQQIVNDTLHLGYPMIRKSLWPDGKSFAVCLTHDVDEIRKTYQWITYPLRYLKKLELRRFLRQFLSLKERLLGKEPFWTFDTVITMEKELGVNSTLFFLNERSEVNIFDRTTWRHLGRRYDPNKERVRRLMHDLRDRGWDIGLHGSFYSYLNFQQLKDEKQYLENALGHVIYGCRQHNLNLAIPETWIYQEIAGINFDSTLGFNDRVGFRWGTCFPFYPYNAKERRWVNILEIPLIIEDLPYFSSPKTLSKDIISKVKNHKGVLTLLWHHAVFNENEYPGWGGMYKEIIQVCQKENAWVGNGYDIYRWWISRKAMNFRWRLEGKSLTIEFSGDRNPVYFDLYLPNNGKILKIENGETIKSRQNFVVIKSNPNSNTIHLYLQ